MTFFSGSPDITKNTLGLILACDIWDRRVMAIGGWWFKNQLMVKGSLFFSAQKNLQEHIICMADIVTAPGAISSCYCNMSRGAQFRAQTSMRCVGWQMAAQHGKAWLELACRLTLLYNFWGSRMRWYKIMWEVTCALLRWKTLGISKMARIAQMICCIDVLYKMVSPCVQGVEIGSVSRKY